MDQNQGGNNLQSDRLANKHLNAKKAKKIFRKKKETAKKYKKKAKRAIEQKMIKQGLPVPCKSPIRMQHGHGGACQNQNMGMMNAGHGGMNNMMHGNGGMGMNNANGMGMNCGMQGGMGMNGGMGMGGGMGHGGHGMMN